MRADIRKPEILNKINQLRTLNVSWNEITKEIERDFQIKAHVLTVKRVYQEYAMRSVNIMQEDEKLSDQIKVEIINTREQLTKINKAINDMLDGLRAKGGAPALIIATCREILNQLFFQEKLLKNIEINQQKIVYSPVQITNVLQATKHTWINIALQSVKDKVRQKAKIIKEIIFDTTLSDKEKINKMNNLDKELEECIEYVG